MLLSEGQAMLVDLLVGQGREFLAGAKYGLSLLGKCSEDVRLPLVGLTDPVKSRIEDAMRFAGLLN